MVSETIAALPAAAGARLFGALRAFACALALFGACLAFAGSATQAAAQDAYILGAGDRVKITVFGEPELSGEFQLDGQGQISLPLIGAVRALGETTRSFENQVAGLYADGYLVSPQVSVEVLNFRPFFILGEVNNPGSYPYREGLTVLNAVALAGGFTYRADEDDIEITRGGDTSVPPGAAALNTPVGPGDMIRVTERLF